MHKTSLNEQKTGLNGYPHRKAGCIIERQKPDFKSRDREMH